MFKTNSVAIEKCDFELKVIFSFCNFTQTKSINYHKTPETLWALAKFFDSFWNVQFRYLQFSTNEFLWRRNISCMHSNIIWSYFYSRCSRKTWSTNWKCHQAKMFLRNDWIMLKTLASSWLLKYDSNKWVTIRPFNRIFSRFPFLACHGSIYLWLKTFISLNYC